MLAEASDSRRYVVKMNTKTLSALTDVEPCAEMKQVPLAIDELARSIECLEKSIAVLKDRLHPILSPEGPRDTAKIESPPLEFMCPIAEELETFSKLIRILDECVHDAVDRLEI